MVELEKVKGAASNCASRLTAMVTVIADRNGDIVFQRGDPERLPHDTLWSRFFGSKEAIASLRSLLEKSLLPQMFSQGEVLLGLTLRHDFLFGFYFLQIKDFFEHYDDLEACDALIAGAG